MCRPAANDRGPRREYRYVDRHARFFFGNVSFAPMKGRAVFRLLDEPRVITVGYFVAIDEKGVEVDEMHWAVVHPIAGLPTDLVDEPHMIPTHPEITGGNRDHVG